MCISDVENRPRMPVWPILGPVVGILAPVIVMNTAGFVDEKYSDAAYKMLGDFGYNLATCAVLWGARKVSLGCGNCTDALAALIAPPMIQLFATIIKNTEIEYVY